MGLVISISQIEPLLAPVLTIIGSFVLFHYSQRYVLQKSRSDIITVIFAKTEMKIGKENKTTNLLQIKKHAEFMNFTVQFIFFICFSIITLSTIQTVNISHPIHALVRALLFYLLFYFIVIRIVFGTISTLLSPREWKIEKIRHYLSFLFYISFYPIISNSLWGIIFYLSFFSYLYVSLFKFSINYLSFALISFLVTFIIFLMQYIPQFVELLLNKIRYSDVRIFENVEPLVFNRIKNKPIIRVWVGGAVIEGEVKEIERDLVIIPIHKQLKEHEIHIRWGAIQAFEVIK